MEPIVQEIDAEALISIFDIPNEMRNSRVEVTIRPIIEKNTVLEKIEQFRKKYNHDNFINNLKKGVNQEVTFEYNVQKLINGTETEEDKQMRYRIEKQTWSNKVIKKRTKKAA